MTQRPDSNEALTRLGELVRAVVRRKSGQSLREDDPRPDNVDARELVQDVMVRLWERLADGNSAPDDLAAYAATVAHNAWADHLRQRYPRRASLRNRLRYFLTHQPAYAVWSDGADGTWTGRHGWQLRPAPAAAGPAPRLPGRGDLPARSVARKPMDRYDATDWDRLLDALFAHAGQPVELDDLVNTVAHLLALQEDRAESLDERLEGGFDTADEQQWTPDRVAEVRSLLRQLWGAIAALKWEYRCAYLLNPPGPGKARAELEVFVLNGVAGVQDIGAVLALQEAHYRHLLNELANGQALHHTRWSDLHRCFELLWPHLPLADALIASMLGLEPQQVINRRMLALRELGRVMGHAATGRSRAGTKT